MTKSNGYGQRNGAGGGLWLSFADIRIHRLNEILGQ
jgi:hypothetical protein